MIDLVIIGTGRLAGSLLRTLVLTAPAGSRLLVAGRSGTRAAILANRMRAHAAALGRSVSVSSRAADLATDKGVEHLLRDVACRCVCVAASSQSPYEKLSRKSAWTDLLQAGGFAVTIPANAALPARVARALEAVGSDATLVNGAFPDAVNPVLGRLTDRQLFGFGNIGTIAAFIGAPSQPPGSVAPHRRILAHHAHLSRPDDPAHGFRIWDDRTPIEANPQSLVALYKQSRVDLNEIAGSSGAALVRALLTKERFASHAPGPMGLPGGYPILLDKGRIALDLPLGLSTERAIAMNLRWAHMDGIAAQADGLVTLTPALAARLRQLVPSARSEIDLSTYAAIRDSEARFAKIRNSLRAQPAKSKMTETNP